MPPWKLADDDVDTYNCSANHTGYQSQARTSVQGRKECSIPMPLIHVMIHPRVSLSIVMLLVSAPGRYS